MCIIDIENYAFVFKVVQLVPNYQVYVSKSKLREFRRDCKTATAFARNLVTEVFSDDACDKCSVTGRVSSARGQGAVLSVQRPPLDHDGVMAIFGKRLTYNILYIYP